MKFLLLTLLLLLGGMLPAAPNLLFRAGFDDTAEPELSGNTSPIRVYGGLKYRAGVKDSAIMVDTENRVEFSAEENWKQDAGTLVFYFAPVNWTPAATNFVFSVTLGKESGDDLLIYKLCEGSELCFLLRNSVTKASGSARSDVAGWRSGEFHQLAVTWNAEKVQCYVDGKLIGDFPKFTFPEFRNITVGTPYPGWAFLGKEASLVDELELYDAPLSESELAAAWKHFNSEAQTSAIAQGYDLTPEALLYVPFDTSAQAAKITRYGQGRGSALEKAQFVPGVVGNAMRLAGKELPSMFYTGEKLPQQSAGSCIVWVKPEWPVANDDVYFLVLFLGNQGRLLLYKPHNSAEFALLLQDNALEGTPLISSAVENYRPGDWIMFAFTWDAKSVRFYINGEVAGSLPARTVPWDSVHVGAAYRDWPSTGTEATLFDELLVLDRPLSGNEIRAQYRKVLDANPALKAAEAQNKLDRQTAERDNLALKSNGGMLVASTFGDYGARYSDNLIDNDPATLWTPFGTEREPIFLELYFRYPRQIDRLTFESVSRCRILGARVLNYNATTDQFEEVKKLTAEELASGKISFPVVTASRLRLVFDEWSEDAFPVLSELGAYGPEQPIPGRNEPYWNAWYIWHHEAGETYYAGEMRYLRTEFELTDLDYTSAVIQSRSNDYYKLWINGEFVDTGAIALTPHDVGNLLRKGKNVIAVETKLSRHPGVWGWGEFLTELSINYPGHSRKIASDENWRGATGVPENWRAVDFDDSGWKKVFCYAQPPDGPWGKIPYTDSSVKASAKLLKSEIPGGTHQPGEVLNLKFVLSGNAALAQDYFYAVEGGFGPEIRRYGDYVFQRQIAQCQDNGDGTVTVSCAFALPPWTPHSRQPLRLAAFHRATGSELTLEGVSGGAAGWLEMTAAPSEPFAGVAKVAYPDGQAAFVINGKVEPPLMWRAIVNGDPMRNYIDAHYGRINVKNFILYGGNIDVTGDAGFEEIFATLDRRIRTWLEVNPAGSVVILTDLRPTTAWMDAHPGTRHVNAFGNESNIVSFASEEFYRACSDFQRRLIDRLKEQEYYPRVIGFQPWVCGVPDSCMGGVDENTWQTDRTKLTAGDYNPEALAKFREFLRERYANDVAQLRKAWQDDAVTFETATPVISRLVAEAPAGEVLRDPATEGAMTFDYSDFLPTLLGNFQRRLFAEVKAATNREKMIFTHYGFIVEHMRGLNTPANGMNNNNYDLPAWLEDDNVDGYIGAPSYGSRFSGQSHLTYFPWSSFALHGRMYLPDDDTRYFQVGTKNYGHNRSMAESRAVIRRNVGADIVRNFGSWFADMSVGDGRDGIAWTGYREIAEELGTMTDLYREAQQLGYESAAEFAVIVSPESMKYLDVMYGSTLMNSLIAQTYYEEIFNIGAPFDIYMQSDLSRPNFPRERYKLYFMMNSFSVSEQDRAAIAAIRAARPDTTWVWFPFSGYVDAQKGNQVGNITGLTDITVRKVPGKAIPKARFLSGSDALLEGVSESELAMPLMPEISLKMHPNELAPQLRIDDPAARVLAQFEDGAGALAVRETPGWKSVYTAVPHLPKQFIRNLLQYAGVHVYTSAKVVFDADKRFLVLNNGNENDQQLSLSLPARAKKVSDALTHEVLGENTDTVSVDLPRTTTRILRTEW